MFEDKTFESLLAHKMELVDDSYDKREGSVIYDAMAPNAAEMAQAYIFMDYIINQMFGTTADREHLILIAKGTRGLDPEPATKAILKGVFNTRISIGARFNLDELNYIVTAPIEEMDSEGNYTYQLMCETAGAEGNRHLGTLTPIDYIANLTNAELVEVLIPGEDEEETEAFRKRWIESFNDISFAGNKSDYRQKIKAIDGVGGVKVYRATNGSGDPAGIHVKCVLIDSEYKIPSQTLIDAVQAAMDPTQDQEGLGLAPIGHIAHIVAADEAIIDITSKITIRGGFTYAAVKPDIEAAIDRYFSQLAAEWEASGDEPQIVRISMIESAILDVPGVLDIQDTQLNGDPNNLTLDVNAIPVRGTLTNNG